MARLKDEYASRMVPELEKALGTTNRMLVPRLQKIVVNMGFGIVSKDEQKQLVERAVFPFPRDRHGTDHQDVDQCNHHQK